MHHQRQHCLQAFVSRMGLLHPDVPLVSMLMAQVRARACVRTARVHVRTARV